MPNWTLTSYRIDGDKKDLKKIYDVLASLGTENNPYNGASSDWEGHVLMALGATEEDLKDRRIRGFILDYGIFGDTLNIEAQEAWTLTDFSDILSELMPDVSIYYRVEEPGCDVFYTNDTYGVHFPETFYLDYCVNGDVSSEYFIDKDAMYDFIGELLGRDDVNDEVIEEWNEENLDKGDYIYIHEFER